MDYSSMVDEQAVMMMVIQWLVLMYVEQATMVATWVAMVNKDYMADRM